MANPKDDPEYDKYCDPDNPVKIKFEDILEAARRMTGLVTKTQCLRAHMSEKLEMEVYMKQEILQYTGCFKERGVRNTMLLLTDDQKRNGVVTASAGNHGAALSNNASQLGVPNIIVMPLKAPCTKIANVERYGGNKILYGNNMAEAKRHAMTIAKEKKMLYINGFDHPHIIEGQGTVGIEIIEQVPNVDAVLVPCGGGSLLAGVAVAVKHLKPDVEVYLRRSGQCYAATSVRKHAARCRTWASRVALTAGPRTIRRDVVGVESEKTRSMTESLKKNERIFLPMEFSIADGLAVNKVGVNTFHTLNNAGLLTKMVVVPEDWVARAIMHVTEEEKFNVEGAGAVGMAALMCGLLPNLKGKRVVVVISGGNIDTTTLGRALDRGMAAEGRLVKFKVGVWDKPGGLAELCSRLTSIGVTIRDCVPERTCGCCITRNIYSVQCKIIAETRGWDHTKQMVDLIKKHYKEYLFQDLNGKAEKTTTKKRGPCLAPNPICMQ
ncbi:hypothetical protein PYW07_007839 [Mythimna separata]|uniref:Serine racemase n=1 Tax=Mythimna separata TaxID=271217 RepID=A0AAD8DUA5_MYTSE|nr:hypothetical protein PYW07_007839 [Mythimna separata]